MKNKFLKEIEDTCRYERTIGYVWKRSVEFRLTPHRDSICLDNLGSRSIGQGDGSRFMHWFTDAADRHGIALKLCPYPSAPVTLRDLAGWYMEYGFKPQYHGNPFEDFLGFFIRQPRKPFAMPSDYDGPTIRDFM